MAVCAICGNERVPGGSVCRFCGAAPDSEMEETRTGTLHKTVNLERGRPFVAEAIKKLLSEIQVAKLERVRLVTIIHGYGSSGKGGRIRNECRKSLDYLWTTGEIKGYIPGEEFSSRTGPVKTLFRQYPDLAGNKSLSRQNPGVTLIIMK